MKRLLLLAPLLIAGIQSPASALPFGNDIVDKTDLGSKFIVKQSVVKTYPWTKENFSQRHEKRLLESANFYLEAKGKQLVFGKLASTRISS